MAEIVNFKGFFSHDWTILTPCLLCTIGSTGSHECTCSSHVCIVKWGDKDEVNT